MPGPTVQSHGSPGCALGVDVGGTKIAAGLVTNDGRLLRRETRPTEPARGAAAILEDILTLARGILGDAREVTGIGIGAVGQIDPARGTVIAVGRQMPPDWAGLPLADVLGETLGLPVRVMNDGHAMALAELRFGAARGARHALCLAIGTGIGGGLVVDGRLHVGAHATAGQFGHTLVRHGGLPCVCGQSGHLETYAAGAGIARRYRELGGADADVFAAARAGDPAATAALDEAADYLAAGLSGLLNAFDADLVILGGGVIAAAPEIVDRVRDAVRTRVLPAIRPGIRVEAAALGPNAGLIGAAAVFLPE